MLQCNAMSDCDHAGYATLASCAFGWQLTLGGGGVHAGIESLLSLTATNTILLPGVLYYPSGSPSIYPPTPPPSLSTVAWRTSAAFLSFATHLQIKISLEDRIGQDIDEAIPWMDTCTC